jgi:hypothetical protein
LFLSITKSRQSIPSQVRERRSEARSLLGLLGRGSLGGSGSGGGGLSHHTHGGVLSSLSLLLADSVLGSSSLSLGLEVILADDFSLGLVDSLNKDVLVLELVTLGTEVKLVVHLAVNLLLFSVSAEQTTKDAETAHPNDLLGHTGVSGTLSLTGALMATLALGLGPRLAAGARVSGHDLSHDQSVLHKLPNVLACSHDDL